MSPTFVSHLECSLTGKRQTPWVALVVGAVIGFIALVVVDVLSRTNEGAGGVAPFVGCGASDDNVISTGFFQQPKRILISFMQIVISFYSFLIMQYAKFNQCICRSH